MVAQRGPGDGQSRPALAGKRHRPAPIVILRCANDQQVAGLPVRVVDQRDLRRTSGVRDRRILIQRHRQRGCARAAAVGAQIQRGPRSLPVQAAGGPAPVVYVHGSSSHVLLRQDGGEGEVQPVQHLRIRAGEAVLAGDRRAVLLHGHSAELQGGRGRSGVEPVLQLRLHLLIGDVGGITVVGEIYAAASSISVARQLHAIAPVGSAANSSVVTGVGGNIRQHVAVLDIRIGIGDAVKSEAAVLHLAVGGDGIGGLHVVFIRTVGQRRQLHKGVGVLYCQRFVGRSHAAFQVAVISQDNAAHQAAHPNIGRFINTSVPICHCLGCDRAAGIALVQRGPAHAGDTAHAQVCIRYIVCYIQHDVRHGGAAGDIHVGRTH